MKILIATGIYPPSIGGPATYTKLLEDELPKHGINVRVATFDSVRKYPKIVRHVLFFILVLWKSLGCKIIYAQDPTSVGLPSLFVAIILRKKFWIRVAGDYAWEQSTQYHNVSDSLDIFQHKKYSAKVERLKKVQSYVVRSAECVVVPSDYFKWIVSGWNKKQIKIRRIYNGVSTENFQSAKDRTQNVVFTFGRLISLKGIDNIIRAIKSLSDKYPNIKLRIAGAGPEERKLKEIVKDLKLEKNIEWLGSISREEIFTQLSSCAVFCLNSKSESFSYAVVEALICGAPVVATKTGAIPEIIQDKENGLLVNSDDTLNLTISIDKLLSDAVYAKKIAISGQERSKRFSPEAMVKEFVQLISEKN